MTIHFYKLFFLIILGISIYYYNLWFAKNLKNGVELHQKFTANRLANPIGGYIIFLFVVINKSRDFINRDTCLFH